MSKFCIDLQDGAASNPQKPNEQFTTITNPRSGKGKTEVGAVTDLLGKQCQV